MALMSRALVPLAELDQSILLLRGRRVILATDLAKIYGVTRKRLNEQVRRNRERFPEDFMFQLTPEEIAELAAFCGRFKNLKHSTSLPHAFTEHGALMLANVLKSETAVHTSIEVVRAFVRLRESLVLHKDLARKIEHMENNYDAKFKIVFDAIRKLMSPEFSKKAKIGF